MKFIKWTNKQKNETWIKEDEYGKSRKSYQKLEELEIFSICNLSRQTTITCTGRQVCRSYQMQEYNINDHQRVVYKSVCFKNMNTSNNYLVDTNSVPEVTTNEICSSLQI